MSNQVASLTHTNKAESLDMPVVAIALPLLLVSLALAGSSMGPVSLALSALGAIAAYALARQALVPVKQVQANTVTV